MKWINLVIGLLSLGFTGVTVSGCVNTGVFSPENRKPNIILVLTDDQGIGQLGAYSERWTEAQPDTLPSRFWISPADGERIMGSVMPNVDKIAAEGVRFTSGFVTSPTCGPSRATLMTGRYSQRFGIYNNDDVSQGVPAEEPFFAQVLKENGYATAAIGKWHLGKVESEKLPEQTRDYHANSIYGCQDNQHPNNKGFDFYFGFNGSGTTYYNSPSLFRNFDNVSANGYITEEFTREALSFINEHADQPFFLYLSYSAPHIPLNEPAPAKYMDRFDSGNPHADNYYASLAAVDDGVGEIMACLKQKGIRDNTIIIFLSDNGAVADSPLPANAGLSGYKGQQYHGGIRVPMVVCWPDNLPSGKVYQELVSSMDLMTSAIAAAGIALPDDYVCDGVDIFPALKGEAVHPRTTHFWTGTHSLHWDASNLDFWNAYNAYVDGVGKLGEVPKSAQIERFSEPAWSVYFENWFLVAFPQKDIYELYDLALTDAGQWTDIAMDHPKVVEKIKQEYALWISKMVEPMVMPVEKWEALWP